MGNKLYMVDGRGKITKYSYGAFGLLNKVTNADNKTISYQYDLVGNLALQIDRNGNHTEYTYDNRNLLLTRSVIETGDEITNQPVEYIIKKSEYIYTNTNHPLKLVEKMYDEAGKELLEKTTIYLYDNNGNEIRQKVSYILPHDLTMRQIKTGNLHGNNITDDIKSLIEKVSNTYDGFNRLKKVEKIKDGERVTVEFIYNGDGLRTTKTVTSSKEGYTKRNELPI